MKITGTITPEYHLNGDGVARYICDLEVISPQPAAADCEAREALERINASWPVHYDERDARMQCDIATIRTALSRAKE